MTNAGRAWVAAAVSVLLIGGFLVADALDEDDATGGTLAGTRWVATEMPGVALVPDALPSVGFTATEVQGNGGCNSMGGAYTASEGRIDVSALSSTLDRVPGGDRYAGSRVQRAPPSRDLLRRRG